jgi:ethanolamine-phosphate cytidylyltransferase
MERLEGTISHKPHYLDETLRPDESALVPSPHLSRQRQIRIFIDGAYDMMHFGHMNAFRLARSLGTHLVVGVNSDVSIEACKGGAPLMSDSERLTMVRACKFVDQVIPDCPYIMDADYLNWVIETHEVGYVVHGDDPCIVNGKDVYAAAKLSGKFRTIPRTYGVSTTDIVGRMLLLTKAHHYHNSEDCFDDDESIRDDDDNYKNGSHHAAPPPASPLRNRTSKGFESSIRTSLVSSQQSNFVTSNRMLQLFSSDLTPPTLVQRRIVYVDGAWDLFHPGHVATLKAAREVGGF